jgi:hypothetical protein
VFAVNRQKRVLQNVIPDVDAKLLANIARRAEVNRLRNDVGAALFVAAWLSKVFHAGLLRVWRASDPALSG